MLTVLVNWALIAITSYSVGFIVLKALLRLMKVDDESFKKISPMVNVVRVFLGLATLTAYAEIWSLFSNVGVFALYAVVIVSLIIVYLFRKEIGREVQIKPGIGLLIGLAVILLMSYGTSRGYMHYDTNLYHAQAIRWIEQYGIVPGLANLQSRFGYNSAEFALNALYSLVWYVGQSLHCTAGFFALMSVAVLAGIKEIWSHKDDNGKRIIKIHLSDYVRLGLLFYLGIIYSEMISPASDYYAQLLIFDIVILWLDMLDVDSKDEDIASAYKGILCILLVYAITIKLSIGLLVLLALIPGIYWIRKKNVKSIVTCIISGLIISVPYFVRNYIISGWILYPSTLIKIGSPDWQIPKGEAQYDAREIGMWGRGITSADQWKDVNATNWIADWFASMPVIEKMWVLGSAVAVIVIIALLIYSLVRYIRHKSQEDMDERLLVAGVIAVGTIFWFCSAPLVRYGYAYLIIMPLYLIGSLIVCKLPEKNRQIGNVIFIVMALSVTVLKAKGLAADILRTKDADYYRIQQDYIDGEASSYELEGVTIYVAEDAGQIGYYKFPSTVDVKEDIELRSDSIEQGFRKKK